MIGTLSFRNCPLNLIQFKHQTIEMVNMYTHSAQQWVISRVKLRVYVFLLHPGNKSECMKCTLRTMLGVKFGTEIQIRVVRVALPHHSHECDSYSLPRRTHRRGDLEARVLLLCLASWTHFIVCNTYLFDIWNYI